MPVSHNGEFRPIPAVNLHLPAALQQLAAVGVCTAHARQLVADDVRIVRARGPVVRQRLAQVVRHERIARGRHRVVPRAEQLQRELREAHLVLLVRRGDGAAAQAEEDALEPLGRARELSLGGGLRRGCRGGEHPHPQRRRVLGGLEVELFRSLEGQPLRQAHRVVDGIPMEHLRDRGRGGAQPEQQRRHLPRGELLVVVRWVDGAVRRAQEARQVLALQPRLTVRLDLLDGLLQFLPAEVRTGVRIPQQ
mmetsp:Transcript_23449/g.56441  ORF Transcript_23449/g.56441 Transcript_23449/m.56441 type:complete len:250 (+) Transcript_23449:118-867(+)